MRLLLSDLAKMSKQARDKALGELVRAAKTNEGGSPEIRNRIRAFEIRYEMTSAEMRRRFADGRISDTADISRWLLYLRFLEPRQ